MWLQPRLSPWHGGLSHGVETVVLTRMLALTEWAQHLSDNRPHIPVALRAYNPGDSLETTTSKKPDRLRGTTEGLSPAEDAHGGIREVAADATVVSVESGDVTLTQADCALEQLLVLRYQWGNSRSL